MSILDGLEKSVSESCVQSSFPYWKMKTGEVTILRFLPDRNPDNLYFWDSRGSDNPYIKNVRVKVFQALIVETPVVEDDIISNPIRRIVFNEKTTFLPLIRGIVGYFQDGDFHDSVLEEIPTDYEHGYDYYLKKIYQGKTPDTSYATYCESHWSSTPRPLSVAERETIATFGLNDLALF